MTVWPRFRPEDGVRVRGSGRIGRVNQVEPNERGDDWLFEIAFDPEGTALHGADELELVEASGQQHEAEIELALRAPSADAAFVVDQLRRLSEETFAVEHCEGGRTNDTVFVEISPRDHPREATRALMGRLGSSWLVEDDGWYANVHWIGDEFPISGVDGASVFLRPWRDPRPGQPLSGERTGRS
jgi:hypothetical protein